MSSNVHDIREKIRNHAERAPRGRRKVFVEPTLEDFAYGSVLAFDQTLTKTGWSVVTCEPGRITVTPGGVLVPDVSPDLKGFEQTYAKALSLDMSIEILVGTWHHGVDAIVHEMPAVVGYRTESSLMAGFSVRRAAREYGAMDKVAMISRQKTYANLVGHSDVEKSHGTARVNALVPNYNRNTTRWTQDVHDSVLLALQWLHQRKAGQ